MFSPPLQGAREFHVFMHNFTDLKKTLKGAQKEMRRSHLGKRF